MILKNFNVNHDQTEESRWSWLGSHLHEKTLQISSFKIMRSVGYMKKLSYACQGNSMFLGNDRMMVATVSPGQSDW